MTKRARLQGELEQLILDSLWDASGALSSQQLLEIISPDGELALTTVLTVLSRLTEKGLVTREQGPGRPRRPRGGGEPAAADPEGLRRGEGGAAGRDLLVGGGSRRLPRRDAEEGAARRRGRMSR